MQEDPAAEIKTPSPLPGCGDEGVVAGEAPLGPDLRPVPAPGGDLVLEIRHVGIEIEKGGPLPPCNCTGVPEI